MATNKTQSEWQKTALRLPRDLHQQVHEAAKSNDRSFNGQVVAFLKECIRGAAQDVGKAH